MPNGTCQISWRWCGAARTRCGGAGWNDGGQSCIGCVCSRSLAGCWKGVRGYRLHHRHRKAHASASTKKGRRRGSGILSVQSARPSWRQQQCLIWPRPLRPPRPRQAACVFVIQRADCELFAPCQAKDPDYARLVRQVGPGVGQAGTQACACPWLGVHRVCCAVGQCKGHTWT